jgi:AAA domain
MTTGTCWRRVDVRAPSTEHVRWPGPERIRRSDRVADDRRHASNQGRPLKVAPTIAGLIDRGDLLAALDRAAAGKVAILSAPAGSGKTTLLRAWAGRPGQAHGQELGQPAATGMAAARIVRRLGVPPPRRPMPVGIRRADQQKRARKHVRKHCRKQQHNG